MYSEKKVSSDNILTFPITLVEGDNGQIGKELYNYLLEKYGNGAFISSCTLDENDEIYINNIKVQRIVGFNPINLMPSQMGLYKIGEVSSLSN